MRMQARDFGCAALILTALLAADGAAIATDFPVTGLDATRLSAQESVEHSARDEERMFLAARRALAEGDIDGAAALFVRLRDKYSGGRFVTDSYYWEAFGRHRQGNLEEALALLDLARVQRDADRYTDRMYAEVHDFRLRVRRELAERGDASAAEEVLRQAEALLSPDSVAVSEARRQFEEQLRDARARWREEFERELEEAYERHRARLDSADALGVLREQRYMAAALAELRMAEDAHMDEVRTDLGLMSLDSLRLDSSPRVNLLPRADSSFAGLLDPHIAGTLTGDTVDLPVAPSAFGVLTGVPLSTIPEGCEDAQIQQTALVSLLRLETDRMPTVRDVLAREDACSGHLRQLALNWLAAEGTEEAQRLLTEVARSHPEAMTRQAAIPPLAGFEGPAVTEALIDILRESDHEAIQGAAIHGISGRPGEEATQALVEFAADGANSTELRVAAAVGAASRVDAASLPAVFNRLDAEAVQYAFLSALSALAAAGVQDGQGDDDWLLPVVRDRTKSERVRGMALQAWSRQPAALNLALVEETYGSLESADLRDQILYVLYQRAEVDEENADAVIDTMIELARGETDPEVRKRAVYWLGRTGSERAAAFLMEILRKSPADPTDRSGGAARGGAP